MGFVLKDKGLLKDFTPRAAFTSGTKGSSLFNAIDRVRATTAQRRAKEAWDAAAPEREAREMAVQTARVQESNAARASAEGASRDAISAPAKEGDVLLDDSGDTTGGVQANRTRKRQTFGVGVTGVNI